MVTGRKLKRFKQAYINYVRPELDRNTAWIYEGRTLRHWVEEESVIILKNIKNKKSTMEISLDLSLQNVERIHENALEIALKDLRIGSYDYEALKIQTWDWMGEMINRTDNNWWSKNVTSQKSMPKVHPIQEGKTDQKDTEEVPETGNPENNNIVKGLQELADLKDKGLIDDEEFKSAKKKLLE